MEKRGAIFFLFSIFFWSDTFFLSSWTYVNASLYNISAVFAFGDSTLDTGNNDNRNTIFKANHPPYGRDLPGHVPSGRCSNGKIMPDFVVSLLGIKDFLPAYLDPKVTDLDLITGVSFASAGCGLDSFMGPLYNFTYMSTQLDYFKECLNRIKKRFGATNIVENALIIVGAGSVDMFNYYDLHVRGVQYSVSSYHDLLLQNLDPIVQHLYKMGARKIAISGLPPIGCVPFQRLLGAILPIPKLPNYGCVDQQNYDSQAYNAKLQDLIRKWKASLPGAKFAYADIYDPLMNIILNPNKYGFEVTNRGCCGTGWVEMGYTCISTTPICSDASKYLFWDAIHPTQAGNQMIANSLKETVLPQLIN
ncbi:GDSL esterase/lipase At2g40250-like [Telopea speciosissima]|uniref:GDSL esterase/lipase At2g40250-like n=1 Tax=Telopea speciosissima TaxID=54955 RepID=UPI001CC35BF4|nr:GDSL esterase/lipase At2g40250-like [Telopea speciosissima]